MKEEKKKRKMLFCIRHNSGFIGCIYLNKSEKVGITVTWESKTGTCKPDKLPKVREWIMVEPEFKSSVFILNIYVLPTEQTIARDLYFWLILYFKNTRTYIHMYMYISINTHFMYLYIVLSLWIYIVFIILPVQIHTCIEICIYTYICTHIHIFTGRGSFIHLTNIYSITNMCEASWMT